MRRFKRINLLALVLLAGLLLLASGCGSSKKKAKAAPGTTTTTSSTTTSTATPTTPSVATDPKIAAEVPAKIKSKGTLTVAADATYPPNEYIGSNGQTVVGWDPDLTKALAGVMGLKANVVNATFATIIPGLSSGKYDLGMSSFNDTKAREKVVDFVTYYSTNTSFFENASGGPKINTLADLCGHKVAVESGTTQKDDATKQDGKCKAAGKKGVTVLAYPDQNGANLALSSGRADVVMADRPVVLYEVSKTGGKFKMVGQSYGTAPYGIAIPKGNGMAKAVRDALQKLVSDGTYLTILKNWGIQGGAITTPKINAAIS